ncbi:MAG TPA: D-aminoacyl-tRNA deacylase [Gaiellaceae bacterium]
MRIVLQRVSRARVLLEEEPVAKIGPGLLVLAGIARGDSAEQAARLAGKLARLRVFAGESGRFERSVLEVGGEVLVVSQFTLLADAAKGTRPSFSDAAPPEQAKPLYEALCRGLRELGVPVSTGVFGARMAIELVNDGPVTLILEA